MSKSVDGTTPVSEPANRVKGIVGQLDEDQLNPESFRVDQSMLDEPAVKMVLTAIPVRKPYQLEFIRVHPDLDWRMGPVFFINLKQNSEFYLVSPELRSEAATTGILGGPHLSGDKPAGQTLFLDRHHPESNRTDQ